MDAIENQTTNHSRKHFTAAEKFKIIKEQVTTKTGVSEICKKYGINATQFYRWQEQFFVGAQLGFEASGKRSAGSQESEAEQKLKEAEMELRRRENVILELAAEVVNLKKSPGAYFLKK